MNTEEDWKREREAEKSCRSCGGRGWVIDRNAPSGGSLCGCDEQEYATNTGKRAGEIGE